MSERASAAKATLIKKHRLHDTDCGSPEVQIAIITKRLDDLTKHSGSHVKDFLAQRGLQRLVSQRKRLLAYLKGQDNNRYKKLIAELGIRK